MTCADSHDKRLHGQFLSVGQWKLDSLVGITKYEFDQSFNY